MSIVHYLPGEGWLSVVRSGVVVLIPATTANDVINRLWNQLGENPNLQAILPVVTGGFGQDLDSMPPFGVVSYGDRLHVLLRGEVRLRATDGGGTTLELSGEHVTTWTERIFDGGAHGFTLSAGADSAAGLSSDAPTLPLEAGIVRASDVRGGSSGSMAGQAPAVEAAPAVEPAPAVEASPAPAAAEPAQPVLSALQAATQESAEDNPERAVTGALEAEELATINPNLYLTSTGGVDEDGQDAGSGADSIREDQNQQSEPDPELQTTGYDHLWDQTVMRRVEDAAVRAPEEDEPADALVVEEPDAAKPQPQPVQPTTTDPAAAADTGLPPSIPPAVGPATEPSPVQPSAPGGLIDSVPWARKGSAGDQPQAAPVAAEPPVASRGDGRSSLDPDDHDGQTIMRSDLQSPAPQREQPSAAPRPGTGPLVLARLCAQGHANPPEASDCGVCSQPLDGEPQEVRRPGLGTMRISTGEVVELDQSLIIGRQPSVSRVQGRGMPKLVQVTSAGGDISRSHVEVRLDGWHVLLCDLKATNGTVLIRSGQPPRRLGEGESAFLLDGDVAQLGDDVFLRFEGLR